MSRDLDNKMAALPIPVRLGDFSVIDSEFNNIREKFDNEMKKMEDEMSRFRNELLTRESGFGRSMITSSQSQSDERQDGLGSWLEGMNSPLVQQDGDNKHLKLRFDVSQYQPEEIVVKTVDNKLMVHAKHEEKSDSHSVYREYNREFLLPKGTNPEAIRSSLSKDGVLTVEAPLPAIESGETNVPIARF